ncbi:MAG: ABC transporter permease [Halobacteriota archaeon]
MKMKSIGGRGTGIKSIDVTVKGVREILRDSRGFALLLGFPVLLIVLFSFAFGSGTFLSGGSIPHEVVVINNDAGVTLTVNNTTQYSNYGASFTGALANATSENSTTKLFHLNNVSKEKADDMLKSRGIDALIIIPKNFSSAFAAMVNNSTRTAISSAIGQQSIANAGTVASGTNVSAAGVNTGPAALPGTNVILPKAGNVSSSIFIQGDAGYMNFGSTRTTITEIFERYRNEVQSNATALAAPGVGKNIFSDTISVETLAIAGTQSFTLYDYLVPGLIVFAVLLQLSLISSTLVKDIETGILDRLKLSKARGFDLLFGTFITWTLITIGQVIILLGVGIALGYKYQGDFGTLGLAALIGVIAGMASISLALLIASFVKNYLQAMSIGAILATPLGFMAGAFLPLPRQELIDFGGRSYQIYDLLPWTHAVNALRSVLTYGSGLSADVIFQLYWLLFLTMILFVIGVVTYSRIRLKSEK